MKIYVITAGEYSDYHICAASLDKEQAEYLRKIYSDGWDDAQIEEFDTDQNPVISALRKFYRVEVNADGTIYEAKECYVPAETPFRDTFTLSSYPIYGEYGLTAQLEAKDLEHAKKIALDKRAELSASIVGVSDAPLPPSCWITSSCTWVLPDGSTVPAPFSVFEGELFKKEQEESE